MGFGLFRNGLILSLALVLGVASAQTASPSGPANPGISKFALMVAQMGALRCVERADQVSRFLSRDGKELVIVSRGLVGVSSEMVAATMLIPMEGDAYATVEISLFPSAGGCRASYSATIYTTDSCVLSETQMYREVQFNPVEKLPYRLGVINANARVLTRQLQNGCLLTKHEVIQ